MEGGDQICVPSTPYGQIFKEGDMVHVFEGTGVGRVKNRDQGWFGKVVGRDGDFFLVRNRLLAAKGRPTRVEPQYMKKQVDFGLTSGRFRSAPSLYFLLYACHVFLSLPLSSFVYSLTFPMFLKEKKAACKRMPSLL